MSGESQKTKERTSSAVAVGRCLVEKQIGIAAEEKREEMIDKEKERNKGKAQVMFTPWLSDFNFRN